MCSDAAVLPPSYFQICSSYCLFLSQVMPGKARTIMRNTKLNILGEPAPPFLAGNPCWKFPTFHQETRLVRSHGHSSVWHFQSGPQSLHSLKKGQQLTKEVTIVAMKSLFLGG